VHCTDGNGTDGNGTGNETDGNGTGNETDGNGTDGNGTDGNGTDGNGTDGNGTDGNGTDGNGTDGNGTDGNGPGEGQGPDNNGPGVISTVKGAVKDLPNTGIGLVVSQLSDSSTDNLALVTLLASLFLGAGLFLRRSQTTRLH